MQSAATYITAVFMVLSTAILGLIAWGMHGQFESLRNEFKQAIADAQIEFFRLVNGKYVSKEVLDLRLAAMCPRCHTRIEFERGEQRPA